MPCKTYRIGVFFDGTGNSLGIDGDAKSNVAKLYERYMQGEIRKDFFVDKHYEVGIGTYMDKQHYDTYAVQRKIDKGYGGGGAKRIFHAIDRVCALLDKHKNNNRFNDPHGGYTKRHIDVFGFSRGAAEARDFVNTFIEYKINDASSDYNDVRFNFIGIFDTVGSFGIAGNNIDMKPASKEFAQEVSEADGFSEHDGTKEIRKKRIFPTQSQADAFAIKKAHEGWDILYNTNKTVIFSQKENILYTPYNFNLKQGSNASGAHIIHFTAHNEKRYNFPLTNIEGSGGFECAMAGVHSDVGGGYPKQMQQELAFYIPYDNLEARAKAQAQGWKEAEVSYFMGTPTAVKMTKEKYVTNDLAVVHQHLMYLLAKRYDVPIEAPAESVCAELAGYFEYAKSQMIHAYTYLQRPEGVLIKEKYIHHSAVDVADIETFYEGDTDIADLWSKDSPDLIGGNDMRYVDKATGRHIDMRDNPSFPRSRLAAQREVYPNIPTNAVKIKQKHVKI